MIYVHSQTDLVSQAILSFLQAHALPCGILKNAELLPEECVGVIWDCADVSAVPKVACPI